MAKQKAFFFDASACTGCKACVIACKDRSDLPVGINWRKVYQFEGGGWVPHPTVQDLMIANNVYVYSLSIACMHCESALCTKICPTQAMYKNSDGVVLIDGDKCIGCRYCEWACPYGAPQFNEETGKMTKCDMCADLQAQGLNPVCVDACVMRALDYGDLDELRKKYGDIQAMAPLPSEEITNPAFVLKPHRHAQWISQDIGKISSLSEE